MSKKDVPFEGILGNTVELRVFEHLLSTPKIDFNITELKRVSGVSRTSVDKVVKKFAGWGIVRNVQTRGGVTYYGLDEDSRLSHSMSIFNGSILERMYPELFEASPLPFAQDEPARTGAETTGSEWVAEYDFPSTFGLKKPAPTPTQA